MDPSTAIRRLFGERVRYFRELRGWQLDDIGSRLGKSRASISRIENGKQNLTMIDIVAIGHALEVPVDALFRQEEHTDSRMLPVQTQHAVAQCRKKVHELASAFQELDSLVAS